MCQKKAIYLPGLDYRIRSFFLCMPKDAASNVLPWMWMKALSHKVTCRIAGHAWLPAASALQSLLSCFRQSKEAQELRAATILSCSGERTLQVLFGQLKRLAGQSTPSHLQVEEGKRVLEGHNDTLKPEYSKKEKAIKRPFESKFSKL